MKKRLTFLLQNFTNRIIFILLFSFFFQFSNAQQNDSATASKLYKKNAVKGTLLFLDGRMLGIITVVSAGYEWSIARQHVIELGGNYFNILGIDSDNTESICIMLGYKYVVLSEKKIFNNTWYSGYFVYFKSPVSVRHDYGGEDPHIYYLNGIGCAMGRKMYFSETKNWFLEIGLGISFNVFDIKPNSPYPCDPFSFWPRPILQVGGRF